jgi:hypothetical protein
MKAATVVATIALALGSAHADDARARKEAGRQFDIAVKAFRRKNYAAAAEHFEEAYKLAPLPVIAFSAAQAYRGQYYKERKLDLALRAAELYRAYLAEGKNSEYSEATDRLEAMEREIAKLKAAGAKATPVRQTERTTIVINPQLASEQRQELLEEVIDTDVEEPKMTVLLDGKSVAPYEKIDVEPGLHKIHVEAEGYQAADSSERALKDDSVIANVKLQPRPARVIIATEGGSRLRVDGRPTPTSPGETLELPAGHHVLAISRAGRETVTREITVTRGQELTLREPLEKTTQRKFVPWVGGVAGGLAVFAGVSFTAALIVDGRAASQQDDRRATGDQTLDEASLFTSRIEQRRRFLIGGYVAGSAALAIGGLAAAMYWFDAPSDGGVQVAPTMSSTGGGVTLGGSF